LFCSQQDKKIRAKLADHGFPCLFIGYPDSHADESYRMFNLETKKAILTRNVLQLDKNYGEFKGIAQVNKTQIIQALESDSEEEDEPKTLKAPDPEPKTEVKEEPKIRQT